MDPYDLAMPDARISTRSLGCYDQQAFTDYLSGIYEHSPWIAQRTWPHGPFADKQALADALARTLDAASDGEKLALIRAHPELAGKAARRDELSDDSSREQTGAGLDQCSAEEFAEIQRLNREYAEKFCFPFIVAVKGLSRSDIIAAMKERLARHRSDELAEALSQIKRIAGFRLADKVID